MRYYMNPNKYREIELSNHKLAHNPTALLLKVLTDRLGNCNVLRRDN